MSLYKVVETGRYGFRYKGMSFYFDLIRHLHTDLGTGLYTEGTGHLKNVKAATNPVQAKFRKNIYKYSDDEYYENILFSNEGERYIADISGVLGDEPVEGSRFNSMVQENSIYEWIAALNDGSGIDRADFTVYGEIGVFSKNGTDVVRPNNWFIVPLFELKGAILVDAVIKRNAYKQGARNHSELTFVADSITSKANKSNFRSLVGS